MTPVRRLQVRARMVVLVCLTTTSLLVGQSIDVVMRPPAKLDFNSAQVSIDVAAACRSGARSFPNRLTLLTWWTGSG
jgi:hypothetical protein